MGVRVVTGSKRQWRQSAVASMHQLLSSSLDLWPLFEASKVYFPLAPLVLRHFGQLQSWESMEERINLNS
jgi:hypothetical protein